MRYFCPTFNYTAFNYSSFISIVIPYSSPISYLKFILTNINNFIYIYPELYLIRHCKIFQFIITKWLILFVYVNSFIVCLRANNQLH